MLTDIKLSQVQLSKTIQLDGFLRNMLGSLSNVAKELGKKNQ